MDDDVKDDDLHSPTDVIARAHKLLGRRNIDDLPMILSCLILSTAKLARANGYKLAHMQAILHDAWMSPEDD